MGSSRNIDVVDQRVLDLLVDGELSDEQERAVIARLDETPDGWRRLRWPSWKAVAGNEPPTR